MCAANAAGDSLAMLPGVPIRRCGGGGVRGVEWCAGVATVAVSFFEFSISSLGTRWSCCLSCLFGNVGMVGHVAMSGVQFEWCAGVVTVVVSFFEFSISGYHLVHQSRFVWVSQFYCICTWCGTTRPE